jgi:Arm DNA-binding domain
VYVPLFPLALMVITGTWNPGAVRVTHRLTIGSYPAKSLADARKEGRSILGQAADGEDPA